MGITVSVLLAGIMLAGIYIIYQALTAQLKIIHDLVNSNLTRVQADLNIALDCIAMLELYIAERK